MNLWETIKVALKADIELNPLMLGGCPVFRNKLFLSEKTYIMVKEQNTGEKEMVSLACKAKQEDHWTYFRDTDYWLHTPIEHKTISDAEEGRAAMGYKSIRIKKKYAKESGLGEDIVEYHLHPDSFIDLYIKTNPEDDSEELTRGFYQTLLLPYPSLADMNNTIEVPDRGYKIASPLGITTYMLHKQGFTEDEWLDLVKECYNTYELTAQDLFRGSATKDEAIAHAVIRMLNAAAGDRATLGFFPKSKL